MIQAIWSHWKILNYQPDMSRWRIVYVIHSKCSLRILQQGHMWMSIGQVSVAKWQHSESDKHQKNQDICIPSKRSSVSWLCTWPVHEDRMQLIYSKSVLIIEVASFKCWFFLLSSTCDSFRPAMCISGCVDWQLKRFDSWNHLSSSLKQSFLYN